MFKVIKGNEIAIMANVIRNGYENENGEIVEGKTMDETLEQMELIDDLLQIMKSKRLLSKKRGLKRVLAGRIEMSMPNSNITPGSSNLQFNDY